MGLFAFAKTVEQSDQTTPTRSNDLVQIRQSFKKDSFGRYVFVFLPTIR